MFGYYPSAPSHFSQYHPHQHLHSRPSSAYCARPSPSCGQQYHHRHPSTSSRYIFRDDDDEEDEESAYYEYLDAARRQQERRELMEAQARRRAQEERAMALAQARREQELERALHRQREREERERRYAEYVQRQLEHERQQQQQQLYQQAQLQQRKRLLQQHRHHQQEQERQSQRVSEDEFARAILGQLGWHPHQQGKQRSTPSPEARVTPAVEPVREEPQQQPAVQVQPRMSYTAAVTLVQSLAKEQISLRQRVRALSGLREEFTTLRESFQMPESLVFTSDAASPTLAYTSANLPLRAHEEALTTLLTRLDAIPSNGSERIRAERKRLAREIEMELERLEREKLAQFKQQQQNKLARDGDEMQQEEAAPAAPADSAMELDPTPSTNSEEPASASTVANPSQAHAEAGAEDVDEHPSSSEAPAMETDHASPVPVESPAAQSTEKEDATSIDSEGSALVRTELDQASPPSLQSDVDANGEVQHIGITDSTPTEPQQPKLILTGTTADSLTPSTVEPTAAVNATSAMDDSSQEASSQPTEGALSSDSVAAPLEPPFPDHAHDHEHEHEHVEVALPPNPSTAQSVSATLSALPTGPSGLGAGLGLGLVEVVSATDDDAEDHGAHSDSDSSDTSFEML